MYVEEALLTFYLSQTNAHVYDFYVQMLIPHKLGITLDQAYEIPEFKAFVHRNHRHERWFDLSKKLEGLPRHTSFKFRYFICLIQSNSKFMRYKFRNFI